MDKRIKKTHYALKQSMLQLLNTHQFEDITVTDICKQSNIVRRTFYAHFEDKYDLVDHMMNDYISEFIDICRYKENIDFETGNKLWFKYLYDNKTIFKRFFKSSLSALFTQKIKDVIENEVDKKLNPTLYLNTNLDKKTLITFLTSGVLGIMVDFTMNHHQNVDDIALKVQRLVQSYFKYA